MVCLCVCMNKFVMNYGLHAVDAKCGDMDMYHGSSAQGKTGTISKAFPGRYMYTATLVLAGQLHAIVISL